MTPIPPHPTVSNIGDLTPDLHNANKGTQRGRGLLEKSLRQYGAGRSILVDKHGRIIAGNKTAEIAGSIGLEDVIIVETDGKQLVAVKRMDLDIDDDDARMLAFADNRTGELSLEWDTDVLQLDFDMGLPLDEFFKLDELTELGLNLGEPEPGDAEPQLDRAEELRELWGVELGQMWRLPSRTPGQEHRLICGDCTDAALVAWLMGNDKIGAVVTDPPYNIDKDDWDTIQNYVEWCKSWFLVLPQVTTFVFTGSLHSGLWWQVKPPRAQYCWHKPNGKGNNPMGGTTKWEPILCWHPPKDKQTDFIEHNNEYGEGIKYLHLTPKPVGLFEKLIEKTTGIIYDPFGGSGTTLIACENLGRQARMVEISPAYVAVTLQRYADAFGITPELVETTP